MCRGCQTVEVAGLRVLSVGYSRWIVRLELPHLLARGISRIWELLTRGQYGSESQENE